MDDHRGANDPHEAEQLQIQPAEEAVAAVLEEAVYSGLKQDDEDDQLCDVEVVDFGHGGW